MRSCGCEWYLEKRRHHPREDECTSQIPLVAGGILSSHDYSTHVMIFNPKQVALVPKLEITLSHSCSGGAVITLTR